MYTFSMYISFVTGAVLRRYFETFLFAQHYSTLIACIKRLTLTDVLQIEVGSDSDISVFLLWPAFTAQTVVGKRTKAACSPSSITST